MCEDGDALVPSIDDGSCKSATRCIGEVVEGRGALYNLSLDGDSTTSTAASTAVPTAASTGASTAASTACS